MVPAPELWVGRPQRRGCCCLSLQSRCQQPQRRLLLQRLPALLQLLPIEIAVVVVGALGSPTSARSICCWAVHSVVSRVMRCLSAGSSYEIAVVPLGASAVLGARSGTIAS